MIHKSLQRRTPLRAKTALKRSPFSRGGKKTLNSTWGTTEAHRPMPARSRSKKKTSKSLSKLKKELDSIFSQYIRLKYADKDGFVKCYTCETWKHWKEMQNGHFISRQYLVTRFDENNCRPQDASCNVFAHGKPLDFEENLNKELGHDFVETMKASRHQIVKLDRTWYTLMIDVYSEKLKDLLE